MSLTVRLEARTRGARALRWVSVAVTTTSAAGLLALWAPAPAQGADVSALTVAWRGGNPSAIQQYQPDHAALTSDGAGNDTGSGHWDDFKDLRISVSKVSGLGDEAVTVDATGGVGGGFLQVFQCWGPDSLADDFAETCQFGAWSNTAGSNASSNIPASPSTFSRGVKETDFNQDQDPAVPFRAVWGEYSQPFAVPGRGDVDGTSAFFTDSTSNELPAVPFDVDGTVRTNFEVQSAASAPHLGCGDSSTAAGARCWLVVVPRGLHSGEPATGSGNTCVGFGYPYGALVPNQDGSPLERRDCTFWEDRVVVPLTFDNPFQQCSAGVAELRLSGSELIAEAIGSWQSALCTSDTPVAYSLTTNSGTLTRSQLLTGSVDFALVSQPLSADTIGSADPALLAAADLRYAPLVNTGLTIAFVAVDPGGLTRYDDIKLTPRLIAKLLTQSYSSDIPRVAYGDWAAHAVDRQPTIQTDPEWVALGNPHFAGSLPGFAGTFIVSGPQGDDAIALLWQYVQADADAVAFLRGEPDPWGMTVNPYYLSAENPAALGGGLPEDLSTAPIDAFLRADQTLAPASAEEAATKYRGQQIDSITLLPYSSSLEANATRIFHTDTKYTDEYDPTRLNSAGEAGAWRPVGPQGLRTGQFTLGPTTTAAAARYDLGTAALAPPTPYRTTRETTATARTFVAPTEPSLSAALGARVVDEASGVTVTDFSALPEDAYPLTTTVYGAVDLADGRLDQATRDDYAYLLRYGATAGQVRGTARGQLPAGYVPLTGEQKKAGLALADELAAVAQPGPSPSPSPTTQSAAPSTPARDPAAPGRPDPASLPARDLDGGAPSRPAPQTGVSVGAAAETTVTPAAPTGARAALGGTLVAGLAGTVASPFLLRRRPTEH